jgi:hypothetical protein
MGRMVVVALLVLSWFAPAVAGAASHRVAAEPSPQKAPPTSSSTPAPDPAPQAVPKSHVSHSTPPPVTTRTTPVFVAPRIVHATAPRAVAARASSANPTPVTVARPAPHHPSHAAPRHRVAAPPAAHPISLSFLLGLFPADLLRLPRDALHAGANSRPDGVLLLLSSLAMGVVAVSSFALFRRLKRLEGPAL